MFEWWRKRKAREAEIKAREERMREALERLEDLAPPEHLNGHEVDSIEAEVMRAADDAVALLEVQEAAAANGTG